MEGALAVQVRTTQTLHLTNSLYVTAPIPFNKIDRVS